MQNSADTCTTTLICKFTSGGVRSNRELVGNNQIFLQKNYTDKNNLPLKYKSKSCMAVGTDYWLVSLLGLLEFVAYPRGILGTS